MIRYKFNKILTYFGINTGFGCGKIASFNFLILIISCSTSILLSNQSARTEYFQFNITDNYETIFIGVSTLYNESLEEGDEVGIFCDTTMYQIADPDSMLCVGAVVFVNDRTIQMLAYADDSETPYIIDGFLSDRNMYFRYYDSGEELEIFDLTTEYVGWDLSGLFDIGGICAVDLSTDPIFLEGLSNQTINEGDSFQTIVLNDYIYDPDHSFEDLNLSFNSLDLIVSVIDSETNEIIIEPPNINWFGFEEISFIFSDPHDGVDTTVAEFEIINVDDDPPVVFGIPHQTIGIGGEFLQFILVDYLTEYDGDSITWSHSGNLELIVEMDEYYNVIILPPTEVWFGSELITFTVTDLTDNSLSDSEEVLFSVIDPNDNPPVLSGIDDQTIEVGELFQVIDLDDFLTEYDGNEIIWGYSGNDDLSININEYSLATIIIPTDNWKGTETIVFTATDNTDNEYSDSDEAIFTVVDPDDDSPIVVGIPDQTIDEGLEFEMFDLDDYLIEYDGDEMIWTVTGYSELLVEIDDYNLV
ncbi:MAG: hypothetical protein ISR90_05725, partial [Candidatus Marinimicrobia bacterium]|nr:hypothetical protein [Candidatus Neomarinimicrobiota bacterium]MBL7109556.1 hypothetical protein [Candidatus Neomarinimicrobiota bacterium]